MSNSFYCGAGKGSWPRASTFSTSQWRSDDLEEECTAGDLGSQHITDTCCRTMHHFVYLYASTTLICAFL